MTAAEFEENAVRERRPLPSITISPMEVLKRYRVVAVVGASRNPEKDAHTVPEYLKEHGYTVIPINPGVREILGEKAYPSLFDVPEGLAKEILSKNDIRYVMNACMRATYRMGEFGHDLA